MLTQISFRNEGKSVSLCTGESISITIKAFALNPRLLGVENVTLEQLSSRFFVRYIDADYWPIYFPFDKIYGSRCAY